MFLPGSEARPALLPVVVGRCCVPMLPISHQPASFVLVLACVVLKPTPPPPLPTSTAAGGSSLCKVGEPLQKVWGDFRHKPSSRRVCAAPGPSTRPRPRGWESPSLELPRARTCSISHPFLLVPTLIQICSRLRMKIGPPAFRRWCIPVSVSGEFSSGHHTS